MDVDSIDIGIDFVDALNEALSKCAVLVAIIGAHWIRAADEEGRRRLDNPDDYVRLEIETALQRNIRVVPLLVNGASMPRSNESCLIRWRRWLGAMAERSRTHGSAPM